MGDVTTIPFPAPRSGLNVTDGPDAPESRAITDARVLLNFYPSGPSVDVRGGIEWFREVYGASDIRSLFTLPLVDGAEKIIAATNVGLWGMNTDPPINITGTTTPTSGDWTSTVFSHRLYLCNGADTVQVSTGTTFSDATFSGVTLSTLVNVSSFKERLYFVKKDTCEFWYGNTQAVGASALNKFNLEYVFKRGGKLLFAGSWTNQTASTSADLFMAVSSEGEVVFYEGSSPAAGDPWYKVAHYKIGRPLGYNAFVEVDNDTWIITDAGIFPVSLLFSGASIVGANNVARKINPIIIEAAKNLKPSHLYWGKYWENGKRAYINVPSSEIATTMLVCNLETGAWTQYQFTNESPYSMAIMGGVPYIGGARGTVYTLEQNQNDKGDFIYFDMALPYSYFNAQSNYKIFRDIRPLMRTKQSTQFKIGVQTNFQDNAVGDTILTKTETATDWGSSWGSPWATSSKFFYDWFSLRGQGHTGSVRVSGYIADAPLEITAFDVRFELGGPV